MKLATLNIGTLRDKEEELADLMGEKRWEVVGLAETRTKNQGKKVIHGNYVLIYNGTDDGQHGVGFMVAPELGERITDVKYVSNRIIGITLKLKYQKLYLIQVYAPQQGRSVEEKEEFYELLQTTVDSYPEKENLIVMGDLNGHVGVNRQGREDTVGAFGIGDSNVDGERVVDFCIRNQMAIINTFLIINQNTNGHGTGGTLKEKNIARNP